jgi:hypothetical protein
MKRKHTTLNMYRTRERENPKKSKKTRKEKKQQQQQRKKAGQPQHQFTQAHRINNTHRIIHKQDRQTDRAEKVY